METIDRIDIELGRGRDTMKFAAEGVGQYRKMRRENLSGRYTINWKEIPVVKASLIAPSVLVSDSVGRLELLTMQNLPYANFASIILAKLHISLDV